MKIYHYDAGKGLTNFGDDLNAWLWPKLLPDFFDEDRSVRFIGMGTLINAQILWKTRDAGHRIFFGTGAGYGQVSGNVLDESCRVYCLRGPLSAKALGFSDNKAITDPAVLIRDVMSQSKQPKKYKYSYMPHYCLAGKSWEIVCRDLGFGYIDPRWELEKVFSSLLETDVLLSEAMHGAIVADALRIPWVPIVSSDTIFPFKWQDWCMSIDVDYQPQMINRLHHPRSTKDILSPLRYTRDYFRQKKSAKELKQIALNSRPVISTDRKIESLTSQLHEKLVQLKSDVESGLFQQTSKVDSESNTFS